MKCRVHFARGDQGFLRQLLAYSMVVDRITQKSAGRVETMVTKRSNDYTLSDARRQAYLAVVEMKNGSR